MNCTYLLDHIASYDLTIWYLLQLSNFRPNLMLLTARALGLGGSATSSRVLVIMVLKAKFNDLELLVLVSKYKKPFSFAYFCSSSVLTIGVKSTLLTISTCNASKFTYLNAFSIVNELFNQFNTANIRCINNIKSNSCAEHII